MKANAVTKKIAENLNPHFRAYVICGVIKCKKCGAAVSAWD